MKLNGVLYPSYKDITIITITLLKLVFSIIGIFLNILKIVESCITYVI